MTTILVTGGAGYIGSHTCKLLAGTGRLPVAFDDLSNGHADAVRWGPLEVGNIEDRRRLREVIAAWRPEAVIHFAGLIEVGRSVEDPAAFYRTNVAGSLALLEEMDAAGVRRIVFSSSAGVYGVPPASPVSEDAPVAPVSPYGETKRAVEALLDAFARAHGTRHVALRYFNATGADPEGELGERHDPETHLVPRALRAVLGLESHIGIFGTDYPTPDGTAIRDYVHVSDLAAAHLAALDYLAGGGGPATVNIGAGRGHSVRQVLDAVRRVTGRPFAEHPAPRRTGGPPELVAATGRAARLLGWTPRLSDLDSIVETAWAWHARHDAPAGPPEA